MQLEAAQRLTGDSEGDSDYRRMSAFVEFYSTPERSLYISRKNFEPQPHVDCQMVNFRLKREAERFPVPSEKAFNHILTVSFSSRRKTLHNNLRAIFPADEVIKALDQLKLPKQVRPQQLNAEHFASISRILSPLLESKEA